ncbi:MAG: DUF86 domain-containing protein [Chloroflexi bacterium]|nr:DUF86 domain-containing protein [Chloroflexota bacterium]
MSSLLLPAHIASGWNNAAARLRWLARLTLAAVIGVRCPEGHRNYWSAANDVSKETQENYPHIPWIAIIGTPNRLIHDRFAVDYKIIGGIVTQSIPQLLAELERIIPPLEDDAE